MYVFRYVFQEITASSDLTLRDKQIETSAAAAGNTIWISREVNVYVWKIRCPELDLLVRSFLFMYVCETSPKTYPDGTNL